MRYLLCHHLPFVTNIALSLRDRSPVQCCIFTVSGVFGMLFLINMFSYQDSYKYYIFLHCSDLFSILIIIFLFHFLKVSSTLLRRFQKERHIQKVIELVFIVVLLLQKTGCISIEVFLFLCYYIYNFQSVHFHIKTHTNKFILHCIDIFDQLFSFHFYCSKP